MFGDRLVPSQSPLRRCHLHVTEELLCFFAAGFVGRDHHHRRSIRLRMILQKQPGTDQTLGGPSILFHLCVDVDAVARGHGGEALEVVGLHGGHHLASTPSPREQNGRCGEIRSARKC